MPALRDITMSVDAGRFGRLLQADAYVKWFRATDYYKEGDGGYGFTVHAGYRFMPWFAVLLIILKPMWKKRVSCIPVRCI